jgi:hypothetical protein
LVLLGQPFEPPRQQRHLRRRRVLLRPVHARRVEEPRRDVARHRRFDRQRPTQRFDRTETAVGRRAPADAHQHTLRTGACRERDQFAGPARRRAQRVVAVTDERETARLCHLDDRSPVGEHRPRRVHRFTERSRDTVRPPGTAAYGEQHVERALTAVGERQLAHVGKAAPTQPRGHRRRRFGRRERAAELVGARDGPRACSITGIGHVA